MYFQNYCVLNDKYGKNKNTCWACGQKHYPPTGKNCKNVQKGDEAITSAALASSVDERDSFPERTMSSKKGVKGSKNAVAREKDSHVKRAQYSSVESDSDHEEALEKRASSDVQGQILKELKRMSSRLNAVEQQVAAGTSSHDSNHDSRRSRAHAQKHQNKQNWGNKEGEKHPWFCKNFRLVLVHTVGTMKQGASCKSTFVPFV